MSFSVSRLRLRMMKASSFLLLLCALFVASPSWVRAQSHISDEIRKGRAERIPLTMKPFVALDQTSRDDAQSLEQLISSDLDFSGLFRIVRTAIPLPVNGNESYEVRGALVQNRGESHFEGRVIDVASGQQIGAKRYKFDPAKNRQIAHHFADEVVKMLTGEDGIARTKILFRRKKGEHWEVVMCDYDGYNPQVLVRQSVPILFPRWIDKNRGLVYTSFRYGQPDLFMRYIKESESKRIASYDGINYSVDWSPKREEMVATLSKDGNPEIYILDKNGKIKRRLTHNRRIDVSASWSPSGREVVFTSDRAGNPHIYVMGADGSDVRRMTIAGKYNESPAWSPRGEYIAYVSRDVNDKFQIFLMRAVGGEAPTQLTNEPFNHEDPRWAPGGRHLVYAQDKGGESVISIIDIASRGTRILAQGESPDWTK